MTSYYEELDDDLLKIVNAFRKENIYNNGDSLFIKRNDFSYKYSEYLLISLIPDMPYVQLLVTYRPGKKIGSSKIIVGNLWITLPIKDTMREIENIRRYNSKVSNPKRQLVPDYKTTLDIEYLKIIKEMVGLQNRTSSWNYSFSQTRLKEINWYDEYIKVCREIDAMRRKPKKEHIKRLVKVKRSDDGIGTPELYG